jgi:peroxiredoxin
MPTSPLRKVLLVIAFIASAAVLIIAGNRVGHELAHRREKSQMADRVSRMNSGESTALRAGDPFPSVDLIANADSVGVTPHVDSRDVIVGREALVFFLSSDCEPCTEAVNRWSDALAGMPGDVLVFGVIDEAPQARDRYAAVNDVMFPILSDSADAFGRRYGMEVYPTVVAVDANGTMVFVRHGVDAGFTPDVAVELLRAGINEGH